MWSVGTLLEGNKQQQSLDEYKVGCIINKLRFEQIFDIVWEKYFPGCHELFANLNLYSGQVEGGTIFDFNMDMPYLVLLKIDFQAMKAEDILTPEELRWYELDDNVLFLYQWCDEKEVDFRDRVKNLYFGAWDKFRWYWDPEEVESEHNVMNVDLGRLQKIVDIAISDITFKGIEEKRISYNKMIYDIHLPDDEISYFKYEQGNELKGIIVATELLHHHYDMLTHGSFQKQKELYLMEDGSFLVFVRFYEGSDSKVIPNYDESVVANNQKIGQFDMDTIVASIIREIRWGKEAG
jgi:hypothetical protein